MNLHFERFNRMICVYLRVRLRSSFERLRISRPDYDETAEIRQTSEILCS